MQGLSVTLLPSGKCQEFPPGTLLAEVLFDMGVDLRTPCGGKGSCGKCGVRVTGALSETTPREQKIFRDRPGFRLACQTCILGEVSVSLDEGPLGMPRTYPSLVPRARYSIAVDIGTTAVRVSLVDETHGRTYELDAFLNPQRRFGHDVISRIAAAADPPAARRLSALIRSAVTASISRACTAMSLPGDAINEIVFAGNTTMLYLLFGLDVAPLGRYPYEASCRDFDGFAPADIDAAMFPKACIHALPVLSAFIGGDLIGGLSVCHTMDLARRVFFIDLGTNGELYLIDPEGNIFATSCAMGPALEGMNISCGMTADTGAINHVWEDNDTLRYAMIGDGEPVGITGTALIDILSLFLKRRIITESGKFIRGPLPLPARYAEESKHSQVELWGDLAITQKDVRNVQLAKGASLAASRMLMQEAGCGPEAVRHVLIAGAFGEHLDLQNFKSLGFIPEFPHASYAFLGNTSLKAAEHVCLDRDFLARAQSLRDKVQEVTLSRNPCFQQEFLEAMTFSP